MCLAAYDIAWAAIQQDLCVLKEVYVDPMLLLCDGGDLMNLLGTSVV